MEQKYIKELRTFKIVADTGSLSKASEKLYMTPQGISKIILKLEESMHAQFFIRNAQGMTLTESGMAFYTYAKNTLEASETVYGQIRAIEERRRKRFHLLSAFGILRLVTPDCLTAFQKRYPDIQFEYHEYKDLLVDQCFKENRGHVALSIGDFDDEIKRMANIELLDSHEIRLLVYKGHPLSYRDSVTIEDLKGEPLYLEGPEFKINHLITSRCRRAGFEPNIVFQTSGFSLCHKMVRDQKGISVTLDFMLTDMPGGNLVSIPFSDDEYRWNIYMLTHKSDEENPAIVLWKQHFSEWLHAIHSGEIHR